MLIGQVNRGDQHSGVDTKDKQSGCHQPTRTSRLVHSLDCHGERQLDCHAAMVLSDSLDEKPQVRTVALPRSKGVVTRPARRTHLDARTAGQGLEASGPELRPRLHVELLRVFTGCMTQTCLEASHTSAADCPLRIVAAQKRVSPSTACSTASCSKNMNSMLTRRLNQVSSRSAMRHRLRSLGSRWHSSHVEATSFSCFWISGTTLATSARIITVMRSDDCAPPQGGGPAPVENIK